MASRKSAISDMRYQGGGGNMVSPAWLSSNHGTHVQEDPYAAMMEEMSASLAAQAEAQAAAQASYMSQMAELQQQAMLQQQEAAKAANVESSKTAGDFTVANANDIARKQMLRRGLMSTYTRYGSRNAQPGEKASKLGG